MPTGPLSGVRVIDLTTIYSGPISTAILGDQGADVIKIEAAAGDPMRQGPTRRNGVTASFAMMNRNKRSIVVDIRTDAGRDILFDLVRGADVLVENFRPGVMDRLGVGYDDLRAVNPRLVFASINGVGATGPYAGRRVYDAVIQAIAGIADLHAADNGKPTMINTLICDKVTAMTMAQAVSSALFCRERTGEGQQIQVSMLDANLFFLWPDSMSAHSFIGDDVVPPPPASGTFFVRETVDGYVAVMPVKAGEWAGTFAALDIPNLMLDESYRSIDNPGERRDMLNMTLDTAYARFTTAEICKRLDANEVPYAEINTRAEVHDDPQVKAMGAIVEYEHDVAGAIRQPRPSAQFSGTPSSLSRCSPPLAAHTDEILQELGRSDAEIAELRAQAVVA
jgi:crotonobetainyl-CoA:carnitine CoA-transferase CaiB-like acyl-CoA transferase